MCLMRFASQQQCRKHLLFFLFHNMKVPKAFKWKSELLWTGHHRNSQKTTLTRRTWAAQGWSMRGRQDRGNIKKNLKKKGGTRESFLPFVWEEGEERSSKVTLWAMHTYCLSKSWSWTEAGNGFNPPSNLSPVSTAWESFLCQIVNSSKHPNSFFFFSYGTWHSQTKPLKNNCFVSFCLLQYILNFIREWHSHSSNDPKFQKTLKRFSPPKTNIVSDGVNSLFAQFWTRVLLTAPEHRWYWLASARWKLSIMVWFTHTDSFMLEIPVLKIILIGLCFPTIYCLRPELPLSKSELLKYLFSEPFYANILPF